MIAVSLTIDGQTRQARRDVAGMTDAEELSVTNGCVQALLVRLNDVTSGNSATLTSSDVSRTTLSDKGSRLVRRSYEVDFVAYFSDITVSPSTAAAAAMTITSDNPLVVSYTKQGGSSATATATSASGGASTQNSGGHSGISRTAVIVICVVVTIGVIGGAAVAFALVKLHQNWRCRT